jgi:hypothetical protein
MDTPFPFPWAQAVNFVLVVFTITAPFVIVAHTASTAVAVVITFIAVQSHVMLNEVRTCGHTALRGRTRAPVAMLHCLAARALHMRCYMLALRAHAWCAATCCDAAQLACDASSILHVQVARDIEDPYHYDPNELPLPQMQYKLNERLLAVSHSRRPVAFTDVGALTGPGNTVVMPPATAQVRSRHLRADGTGACMPQAHACHRRMHATGACMPLWCAQAATGH